MARYIDAEKLINNIDAFVINSQDVMFIRKLIADLETEDVKPVIHAQWGRYNATAQFYCTNCHDLWQGDFDLDPFDDHFYYCPSCGAKMDEVQDG